MVLVSNDDNGTVVFLATLEAGTNIRKLVLEVPDAFILGGDLSLRLVESEVAVCDAALGFLNAEKLGLDVGTQSLDGGDVLVTLALDEANGFFGLAKLSLSSLIQVGGREEFL